MSNPLSLVPYALAASDRSIGGIRMNTLVAAGFTLLQRCAPLVRVLAASRPALLLPPGPQSLVALAACDGHVALILDQSVSDAVLAEQIQRAGVGVVFTLASLAGGLPTDVMSVVLDNVPLSARVHAAGTERNVDLGSHVGLRLQARADVPFSDAAVASWFANESEVSVSHSQTMTGAGPLSWLADES